MDKLKNLQQNKQVKKLTKKSDKYKKFLFARVGEHIESSIAKFMVEFSLSKRQNKKVLRQIEKHFLKNKKSQKIPQIHLVIAQAGAGKSVVSKQIIKSNPNTVHIDTDLFKQFNPLARHIIEHCPEYYAQLTALDCYLHRDYLYKKILAKKYNVVIEITPSTKQGLFNVDFESLNNQGYKICAHIISVCKQNSLLSVHERYEKQLEQNYISPKLSDFARATDSFYAVMQVVDMLCQKQNIEVLLYDRQGQKICCDKNLVKQKYSQLQQIDFVETKPTIEQRINCIENKMKARTAPQVQIRQFEKIKKEIQN
ncbi:MAG: zeta toxin family protein [Clostridia bacterium]|nr:zeta toxin family protein [Clostridia bacterium]